MARLSGSRQNEAFGAAPTEDEELLFAIQRIRWVQKGPHEAAPSRSSELSDISAEELRTGFHLVTKVRLHHGQVSEEYLDQRYGRSFRRSCRQMR